ncbi:hypothetical protein ACFSMW_16105 [Virgibacillus halophilus]|uniref:Uncharacterized protein n=1 Tax=Tigheibacillus halophilus TaxID=361280 RepID=A0ABU5C3S2_9BACI|nr:hypothetical protein [Virgibacillus halophilus]
MGEYEIEQVINLLSYDLETLVKQSKEEGFRFVERLLNDYKNGSNMFSHCGEGIFGVFNNEGVIVAIGGLNKDLFSNEHNI